MSRVTATPENLMSQASYTAGVYLRDAAENIDKLWGDGYAKANPVLTAALIAATAQDFHTSMQTQSFDLLVGANEAMANALSDLGISIDQRPEGPTDHTMTEIGKAILVSGDDIASALRRVAEHSVSPNESDSNLEPANLVDALFFVGRQLGK